MLIATSRGPHMHEIGSYWYLGPQAQENILSGNAKSNPFKLVRKIKLDDAYQKYCRLLEAKGASFDFLGHTGEGATLLVGEGNLSFALSLAKTNPRRASNLLATTFESRVDISNSAKRNASYIRSLGSSVEYSIDATKLNNHFSSKRFHLIIFQFPNVHSRNPVYGRNPNHVMIRRFLKSAAGCLLPTGLVAISIVNSPYYLGAFNLPDAGKMAGLNKPEVYPFRPSDFSGYTHVNTEGPDSAITKYDSFSTWVFQLRHQTHHG
ncbi:class I SAM-dependent methyltransferase [Pyruvatibacter sp.]